MVLIFEPKIKEVIKIKKIGKKFKKIRKSNFLSLKLILKLIFFANSQIKKKNGVNIPICLIKKING